MALWALRTDAPMHSPATCQKARWLQQPLCAVLGGSAPRAASRRHAPSPSADHPRDSGLGAGPSAHPAPNVSSCSLHATYRRHWPSGVAFPQACTPASSELRKFQPPAPSTQHPAPSCRPRGTSNYYSHGESNQPSQSSAGRPVASVCFADLNGAARTGWPT